jgi:hypothetical protein
MIDRRAHDHKFWIMKQQKESTLEWHQNLTPESNLKDLVQESGATPNRCTCSVHLPVNFLQDLNPESIHKWIWPESRRLHLLGAPCFQHI